LVVLAYKYLHLKIKNRRERLFVVLGESIFVLFIIFKQKTRPPHSRWHRQALAREQYRGNIPLVPIWKWTEGLFQADRQAAFALLYFCSDSPLIFVK